jgi:hypothetical protein
MLAAARFVSEGVRKAFSPYFGPIRVEVLANDTNDTVDHA